MTVAPRLPSVVLSQITKVVCGDWPEDEQLSPYRTHGGLRDLFRCDLGLEYLGSGSSSRFKSVQEILIDCNGTVKLCEIIEASVHPVNYAQVEGGSTRAVDYLNTALVPCGYRLERYGQAYRLIGMDADIAVTAPDVDLLSTGYIRELADKAEARLQQKDHEGAITTARTLVESVLVELESRITGERNDHKRDLQGQFTVVRKLLHIDEERRDLDDSFKTMIRGLVQIINGLAPLRNKMSDGHARTRKPAPHHARFAVNAAKTVAYFLVESYAFQSERGLIQQAAERRKGA